MSGGKPCGHAMRNPNKNQTNRAAGGGSIRGIWLWAMVAAGLAALEPGTAEALGAAPDNIKLYRSRNQGAHWELVGKGLPVSARVNALMEVGGRVVAGTDSGTHHSDDDGTTWQPAENAAGPIPRVLALAQIPGRIFAGTEKQGVLRSDNRGETWQAAGAGGNGGSIRSLLGVGNAVYAGTDQGGVLVSEDGGETWKCQSAGLPDHAQVFDLAEHGGKVYAGLYAKGLYSWEAAEGAWVRSGRVLPLEIASSGKSLIAGHNPGGIFYSDDLGKSWKEGSRGMWGGVPVWSLAAADGFALAGVASNNELTLEAASLFTSRDGGRSWSQSDQGIPAGSSAVSFLIGRGYLLAGLHLKEPKAIGF